MGMQRKHVSEEAEIGGLVKDIRSSEEAVVKK